jgi:hypothetical protein
MRFFSKTAILTGNKVEALFTKVPNSFPKECDEVYLFFIDFGLKSSI